jgi:hypothetical protein
MPIGGGFHVITAGTVALDRGSVEPLGAGDCFGASALLCDGPPDPPPIALTAVSTLTLTRPEFMSRVTAPGTAPRSASSTQSRR